MLKKIMAGAVFLLTLFGLFQRNRADRAEAEAENQSNRADAAESTVDTNERVNKRLDTVKQTHRKEQIDAKQRLDAGDRSHLDNNG